MSSSIKRLAFFSFAVAALTFTTACTAYAQHGRAVRRGPVVAGSQSQFDRGYREGVRAGERDLRSRDRFDYRDERAWQRAGSRSFREGFERGYAVAYRSRGSYGRDDRDGRDDRYGRDGRDGRYGRAIDNPAASAGYEDGYRQGVDDARDGDRSDPVRARHYREGDRGYDRRYGSRDEWKRVYREAFLSGYQRGYREGR
jgi:hypothetical protein